MTYPNWFAMYADQYFERHLSHLAGQRGLRFLQIGAYTGDATLWLFEHVLTASDSQLVDVDTWRGSDEPAHDALDFADVERVYNDRTCELRAEGRLHKRKMTSRYYLSTFPYEFDFIYIDGDHTAPAVLADAALAIPLLRSGGLIAFDDYKWQSPYGPLRSPAIAINAVGQIYAEHLTLIDLDAQAWFRAA